MSGSSLTEEFLQRHLNPIGWNTTERELWVTPKREQMLWKQTDVAIEGYDEEPRGGAVLNTFLHAFLILIQIWELFGLVISISIRIAARYRLQHYTIVSRATFRTKLECANQDV
jgi:hypothetical protein